MGSCTRRHFLLSICVLQLLSIIERQVFDFLGYMWAPILVNFFHIIFVIFGFFGAYQLRAKYVVTYSIWTVCWIGWNVFLICFYLNVGILDRDSDILNLGTGSISWFEINGYGCKPTFSTNITSEDPFRPVRPETVDGCLLDYPIIEVIQAVIQCALALLGLLGAICLGGIFIDEDDSFDFMNGDAKSPQHTAVHPMYVSYTSLPTSASATLTSKMSNNNLGVLKNKQKSNINSINNTTNNNNSLPLPLPSHLNDNTLQNSQNYNERNNIRYTELSTENLVNNYDGMDNNHDNYALTNLSSSRIIFNDNINDYPGIRGINNNYNNNNQLEQHQQLSTTTTTTSSSDYHDPLSASPMQFPNVHLAEQQHHQQHIHSNKRILKMQQLNNDDDDLTSHSSYKSFSVMSSPQPPPPKVIIAGKGKLTDFDSIEMKNRDEYKQHQASRSNSNQRINHAFIGQPHHHNLNRQQLPQVYQQQHQAFSQLQPLPTTTTNIDDKYLMPIQYITRSPNLNRISSRRHQRNSNEQHQQQFNNYDKQKNNFCDEIRDKPPGYNNLNEIQRAKSHDRLTQRKRSIKNNQNYNNHQYNNNNNNNNDNNSNNNKSARPRSYCSNNSSGGYNE